MEYRDDHESREVPPPADEPGGGETHEFEGFIPENHEPAGLGMDVDAIDYKPETDLKELFSVMTRDARTEIGEDEREIIAVIRYLGGDGHRYRRERQRAMNRVVSEIYSPPRVAASINLLPELRLIPGFSLDLTFDINIKDFLDGYSNFTLVYLDVLVNFHQFQINEITVPKTLQEMKGSTFLAI